MQFDEVLKQIGDVGTYQVCLLIIIAAMEFLAADSIQMNFMGYNVDHWCRIPRLTNFSHEQQQYIAIPDEESCQQFPLEWNNYTDEEFMEWDRNTRTGNLTDYRQCGDGWVYDRSEFVATVSTDVSTHEPPSLDHSVQ